MKCLNKQKVIPRVFNNMNPWVFLCLRYSKYQNVSHRARLNFRWGYSYMGLLGLTCGSQTPRRNVKVKRNFYSDFQTSCYFFLSQQQHIANCDKRLNRSVHSYKGSSIYNVRNIFYKTNMLYPLIRQRMYAYQGVRKVCVRTKWWPHMIGHQTWNIYY